MSRAGSNSSYSKSPLRQNESYWRLSMRPLHVLIFLLPMMLLYEVGSLKYLVDPSSGMMSSITARSILSGFFDLFGAASFHLPPIVLTAVLLIWHTLEGDSWKIKPEVLLGMLLEAAVCALPILVFSHFMGKAQMAAVGLEGSPTEFSWQAKLTVSFGAGVYEELLFRLILVTAVHMVLVDLLKMSKDVGYVVAGVASALAFALYHQAARHDTMAFLFYAGAGAYFAAIFIIRGFGVAVGTHAMYDVVVLITAASQAHP